MIACVPEWTARCGVCDSKIPSLVNSRATPAASCLLKLSVKAPSIFATPCIRLGSTDGARAGNTNPTRTIGRVQYSRLIAFLPNLLAQGNTSATGIRALDKNANAVHWATTDEAGGVRKSPSAVLGREPVSFNS